MTLIYWLLALCSGAILWLVAVRVNRRNVRAQEHDGNADSDLIVFVEPVRWLFIIWGFAPFCRGLRRGGCDAQVRLFRWGSVAGSLLVIPDLVRQRRLLRKAERLARQLDSYAAERPDRRIHLVGYSSGAYIALEACQRMTKPGTIGTIVLLAGTMSPHYRLEALSGRVQRVCSFYSRLDLINIVGPVLFGSNDRRWGLAGGAIGFRGLPGFATQRAWRARDAIMGYLGDHFTVVAPRFVAQHVAPCLDSLTSSA
jgi:hypothetical protein